MPSVRLNHLVISQNLLKFVQDSDIATSATFLRPEKFDPNRPTVDSWVQVSIVKCGQGVGRLEPGMAFDGVVRCECYARTQNNKLAHVKLCSEVQDALCQAHFSIRDYQTNDDPIIGFCSLYEPEIADRGASGLYQLATLTIKFHAEQTV